MEVILAVYPNPTNPRCDLRYHSPFVNCYPYRVVLEFTYPLLSGIPGIHHGEPHQNCALAVDAGGNPTHHRNASPARIYLLPSSISSQSNINDYLHLLPLFFPFRGQVEPTVLVICRTC